MFSHLPIELQLQILSYLSPTESLRLQGLSRHVKTLMQRYANRIQHIHNTLTIDKANDERYSSRAVLFKLVTPIGEFKAIANREESFIRLEENERAQRFFAPMKEKGTLADLFLLLMSKGESTQLDLRAPLKPEHCKFLERAFKETSTRFPSVFLTFTTILTLHSTNLTLRVLWSIYAKEKSFNREPRLYIDAWVVDSNHQISLADMQTLNAIGKLFTSPCVLFHNQPICQILFHLAVSLQKNNFLPINFTIQVDDIHNCSFGNDNCKLHCNGTVPALFEFPADDVDVILIIRFCEEEGAVNVTFEVTKS